MVTTGGWLPGPVTVQVKLTLSEPPLPSSAVTVTLYTPALPAGNVPLIWPVPASIDRPGGSPLALKVNTSPSGSLATMSKVTPSPSALL